MTQRERRIFVYRPGYQEDDRPELEPERESESEPASEPSPIRDWLFSPVGMVVAWVLAAGLAAPAGLLVLATLRERYIVLLFGFGLWLLFGLIVVHWWIPSANPHRDLSERIAASGWHITLSLATTGAFAWFQLFGAGYTPAFTLADTRPVIVAGALFTALSGLVVLWARGHTPGRMLRYGVIGSCMLAVWMALWLVAAHGGL